jgi:hypothetical protein
MDCFKLPETKDGWEVSVNSVLYSEDMNKKNFTSTPIYVFMTGTSAERQLHLAVKIKHK